jgi:hypothetical protein
MSGGPIVEMNTMDNPVLKFEDVKVGATVDHTRSSELAGEEKVEGVMRRLRVLCIVLAVLCVAIVSVAAFSTGGHVFDAYGLLIAFGVVTFCVSVGYILVSEQLVKLEREPGVVNLRSRCEEQSTQILVVKRGLLICFFISVPCISVLLTRGNSLLLGRDRSDSETALAWMSVVSAVVLLLINVIGVRTIEKSGFVGLFHEAVTFTLMIILLTYAVWGNILVIFALISYRYAQAVKDNEDVEDIAIAPFLIAIVAGCVAILFAFFGYQGLVTPKATRATGILATLAGLLLVMLLLLLTTGALFFKDGFRVYDIVDGNCEVILRYTPELWLKNEVDCNKYSGKVTRYLPPAEPGPGDIITDDNLPVEVEFSDTAGFNPICEGSDPIVNAWEYSGEDFCDGNCDGCLNLVCCDEFREIASESAWLLGSLCIWLAVTFALGIICALYLRRHIQLAAVDGDNNGSGDEVVGTTQGKAVPLTTLDLRLLALLVLMAGLLGLTAVYDGGDPLIVPADEGTGNQIIADPPFADPTLYPTAIPTQLPSTTPTAQPTGAPTIGTCVDGIQNGAETDIDCGGADCVPCSIGEGCLVDSDCGGGLCVADLCVATESPTSAPSNSPTLATPSPSASPTASPTISPCVGCPIVPERGMVAHLKWSVRLLLLDPSF